MYLSLPSCKGLYDVQNKMANRKLQEYSKQFIYLPGQQNE